MSEVAGAPEPMSQAAMNEMLCDWITAAREQGSYGVNAWYSKNKGRVSFSLHPETIAWAEQQLEILP